uniref:UL49A n=1 Tax=Human herpesvirus 1 TaxID=10298 RepID=Q68976_HHV1|nr:unknown protein [Human alphaherpesvirus 1]
MGSGTRGAGPKTLANVAPGALVPFYVGMASMGVCIIAHVCQICQRLLAAGQA